MGLKIPKVIKKVLFLFFHLFLNFSIVQAFRRLLHLVRCRWLEVCFGFLQLQLMLLFHLFLKFILLAIELVHFCVPILIKENGLLLISLFESILFLHLTLNSLSQFLLIDYFFQLINASLEFISLHIVSALLTINQRIGLLLKTDLKIF